MLLANFCFQRLFVIKIFRQLHLAYQAFNPWGECFFRLLGTSKCFQVTLYQIREATSFLTGV